MRGIFPVVATVDRDGFRRVDDDELAQRTDRAARRAALATGRAAAMTMPYYVAPEQAMKDKADFARKGIARGRSAVVLTFDDGVLLCAENPSTTLRKLAEIYDRIAFAGVGKFNEFDQLRIAGIRHADLKGYSYSREDVDARSLANQYAQILGQIFTHEMKPMEVEIVVAEIGDEPSRDQLFHIRYDGTVIDETRFIVIGGDSETIAGRLRRVLSAPGLARRARCASRCRRWAAPIAR